LQEEQVANRTLASSQASSVGFAVDGTGKMHAFWAYLAGGNGTIAFEYASNSTGSWVIEQLPDWSVQFNSPNSVLLNVDPAGGLHALVNQGTALAHAERPAGGMWLWELVSTDDGSGETSYFFGDSVQCASPVAGDFRVFFSQTKSNNTVYELVEAHKANGAWLAPQVVMTQPNHGSDGLQIAVRSDGLRQAARIRSSDGDALYVDDGAGWKRTLVDPELRGAPALGFKPDGSLYLLEHAPSPVEWVLYEEH
jgi:hypothetical protein